MRTLVIGGTAFMGRAIVERLLQRGHDVAVLHRRDRHDLGPDVRNIQANRADVATVSAILAREPFEAVFDLAYDWQHGTTAAEVEAAARACGDRLQRYVFMSSIAAYGPGVDHREHEALAPDTAPDPYTASKAAAERALFRLHETSGLPVVTVRPPFVHGPRQPFYREQFFWDRLLDGRPIVLPDGGQTPMQWAFVFDVADTCVRALEVPEAAGEAFNIAHVEPMTQRSFVEALARVASVDPQFAAIPRGTIHATGGRLMGTQLYFGEYLDLPVHTEVVEKTPRLLGIVPTGLQPALSASFAWYQTQPRRSLDYAFEDRLLAEA
jgi:nucleoside-diphosphate-sugar epimerase